jgi:hypothetical protein
VGFGVGLTVGLGVGACVGASVWTTMLGSLVPPTLGVAVVGLPLVAPHAARTTAVTTNEATRANIKVRFMACGPSYPTDKRPSIVP